MKHITTPRVWHFEFVVVIVGALSTNVFALKTRREKAIQRTAVLCGQGYPERATGLAEIEYALRCVCAKFSCIL